MGPMVRDFFSDLQKDAEKWCEGKRWLPRAFLWLYLVYAGVRHLFDPLYRSWFAGITLILHEMGHLVFMGFGHVMHILGGSLMQLFVPAAAGTYLILRQRDWFGLSVCGAWLGFSAWDLATYIDDANRDLLPLVGFGDNPKHDWGTLLAEWHLLNASQTIATVTRVLAFACWAPAVLLGAWLWVRMARSP
jgi:hypothetical protein